MFVTGIPRHLRQVDTTHQVSMGREFCSSSLVYATSIHKTSKLVVSYLLYKTLKLTEKCNSTDKNELYTGSADYLINE